MTSPAPRIYAITGVAFVAAIACACVLSFLPASNPEQYSLLRSETGVDGPQNRQLLSLPALSDPKTVELRTSHFLPFRIQPKSCVTKEKIIEMSRAIKDLNSLGIRIFPRNGFLLGVIRHGGYLPTEGIDADLGVMYDDIARLNLPVDVPKKKRWTPDDNNVGDFLIQPHSTDLDHWVNWKGRDPMTGEPYPFYDVKIYRHSLGNDGLPKGAMVWQNPSSSVYPYYNSYNFFPRVDVLGFNHEDHIKELFRWNHEGANMRLVDTDELVTEINFAQGKQIGTVFPSKIDCMVEKQFYFTTILVPCDYDVILQAQYGIHWSRVEPRPRARTEHESKVVSMEESDMILENGPLPLCSG